MIPAKKILVLSPHPDDGEFGCGAIIARYVDAGAQVWVQIFSLCEESLPKEFSTADIRQEAIRSWATLGVPSDHILVADYKVRRFPGERQAILEDLVARKQELDPDLVFMPSSQDIHQDHQVISQEGFRSFKQTNLLGYELVWNTIAFPAQLLFEVQSEYLQAKIDALKNYKSQEFRGYMDEQFIEALARVRGIQAGKPLAEAFEVFRLVE